MFRAHALVVKFICFGVAFAASEPRNIHEIPSDLKVPGVTGGEPMAGRRVKIQLPDTAGSSLFHVLYLPKDWEPGKRYPVIVEYPGNGGFANGLGDISTGRVEDCKLGYGVSGGRGFIWVCLPFVDSKSNAHALNWWGDADATAKYCRDAVSQVCDRFGGDPGAVVLTGFSRGAIACSYIGLRNDETAALWRAIIAHSHFDGVRKWNYEESDAESARSRLKRLKGRPLYVTHEMSVDETAKFLNSAGISATLRAIPFPNHSDEWVLKDLRERAELRQWLSRVLSTAPEGAPALSK